MGLQQPVRVMVNGLLEAALITSPAGGESKAAAALGPYAEPGDLSGTPQPFSEGAFPMRRTLFVGLTWLLVCVPSFAQTLGTITGEVRDSSGAVIPGVTVTVVNKATNATRTTVSNEVGLFDFPALQPGLYTVTGELAGFKTAIRDIEL